MKEQINWREIVGATEISQLKRVADFLIEESKKQDEVLKKKGKEWERMHDGGEEYQGYTKKEWDGLQLGEETYEIECFQQILFRSFISTVFAFIEHDLKELCNQLQKMSEQKFSLRDMKGNGMYACLTYLDRILEHDFMLGDADIRVCRHIRNALDHGDTKLSKERQSNLQKNLKGSNFKIDFHNDEIYFEKEHVYIFIQFADKVWKAISNQ